MRGGIWDFRIHAVDSAQESGFCRWAEGEGDGDSCALLKRRYFCLPLPGLRFAQPWVWLLPPFGLQKGIGLWVAWRERWREIKRWVP